MTSEAGGGDAPVLRRRVSQVALVAVALVSLVLLWPQLRKVYGELDAVVSLPPGWLVAIVASQVAGFASVWQLQRMVLRDDRWMPVVTAQLASNAVHHVVPAGAAVGTALQLQMLRRAGFDLAAAGSALAVASVLTTAGLFALPMLAVPALLSGTTVSGTMQAAVWIGVGFFAILLGIAAALLKTDRPVRAVAGVLQRLRDLVVRDARKRTDLRSRVITERDHVRDALSQRKVLAITMSVAKAFFDYLALLLALAAVGAGADPVVALVAFAAGEVAGAIPFTPGGVGFVEAGLAGALVVVGVDEVDALVAVAAYRVASYWLPVAAGAVAYALYRRSLS